MGPDDGCNSNRCILDSIRNVKDRGVLLDLYTVGNGEWAAILYISLSLGTDHGYHAFL